jgi:broad specificity phosphatase PhoE
MTFYLARHGRSLGEGLFLGQSDPGLSEEGRGQAEALAEGLAGAGIERIVCSTLRRSSETAAILGERLKLPVEQDPRLRELGYGRWDGLSWTQIEERWPKDAQRKLADWWGVTPQGGESQAAFLNRVKAFWEDLQFSRGTTLVVGHAGVNGLLAELAQSPDAVDWDRVTRFEQGYGEVRAIEVK